jgi:LacI family transcriptional regulator, repressor for deo operon, udp, cdd, tsx, nupC, and nupG
MTMTARRRSTAPTILDVARECGLAASTVSRAFVHPTRVNEATRARILHTAERLGYRPGLAARSMPPRRTSVLAMLVPDVTNPFFSQMMRGAQQQAVAAGYTLVLADMDEVGGGESLQIDRLVRMVDGIIIGAPRLPGAEIARLAARCPVVLINGVIAGVPHVVIDTSGGMRQACDHLISLGHRDIAYLAGPHRSWADNSRWRALQAARPRAGLEVTRLGPFAPTIAGGVAAADALMLSGATAAVAYNDLIAVGTIRRLLARGVRVPADVSVLGCDDTVGAEFSHPSLTTLTAPIEGAGRAATRLLCSPSDDGRPRRVVFPADLIVRDSTAAPRTSLRTGGGGR